MQTKRSLYHRALAPLELQLRGRAHLLGEFSLADIAYAPSFANLAAAAWDLSRWPNVRAWTSGVLARPAWLQATQA